MGPQRQSSKPVHPSSVVNYGAAPEQIPAQQCPEAFFSDTSPAAELTIPVKIPT